MKNVSNCVRVVHARIACGLWSMGVVAVSALGLGAIGAMLVEHTQASGEGEGLCGCAGAVGQAAGGGRRQGCSGRWFFKLQVATQRRQQHSSGAAVAMTMTALHLKVDCRVFGKLVR
jgi:hypothetical protein